MAHAVSSTYLRFDHMSPTAAGMAGALHLLTALALWWVSPLKHIDTPAPQPIEVTMEEPAAPKAEIPPPPQRPAAPPSAHVQPAPPPPAPPRPTARLGAPPVDAKATPTEKSTAPLGVKPPTERTTEPPQQAAAQPPPPQKEAPTAEPAPAPTPETKLPAIEAPPAPQQAAPQPPPPQKEAPTAVPAPAAETKLPAIEAPPAPLSMQDFVRAAPPPPPQEIVRPQPHVQPTPPSSTPTVQQAPPQQFAPSPLGHPPQQQRAPAESQASAALVNPAVTAARTRVADEYVWAVIRKFSQYLPDLREKNEGGTVVVRMVIARDGRLLESGIARSSGVPMLDKGMLEALRAAAPYPPLPAEIPGDHIVFTQPITARR